jgi:hypothetical protein
VNRTQCPRLRLGSRCVSRCDGHHKKALLPPRRALLRHPPLAPCTTLALLGELQPLARQFFVAPFALLVPAVRGLPAFCRMGADAFGSHIEMAAQTERSRGAKKILVLTANGFLLWGLSWSDAAWRRQIEGARSEIFNDV